MCFCKWSKKFQKIRHPNFVSCICNHAFYQLQKYINTRFRTSEQVDEEEVEGEREEEEEEVEGEKEEVKKEEVEGEKEEVEEEVEGEEEGREQSMLKHNPANISSLLGCNV